LAASRRRVGGRPEPPCGTGVLSVDYERAYYDIWQQAVMQVFFRAIPIGSRFRDLYDSLRKYERSISIVRTAGAFQAALGGEVEQEALVSSLSLEVDETPSVRAMGYLAGNITDIGPDYSALVGSFRAQETWMDCCENAYARSGDSETVRELNETYSAKIIDYSEPELSRIREIRNRAVVAWHVDVRGPTPSRDSDELEHSRKHAQMWEDIAEQKGCNPAGPRISIGTNRLIALVPAATEVGDVVVRFWNCSAAFVMRPASGVGRRDNAWPSVPEAEYYMLLGRADVADSRGTSSCSADGGLFSGDRSDRGLVWVNVGMRTLQLLTASVALYGP